MHIEGFKGHAIKNRKMYFLSVITGIRQKMLSSRYAHMHTGVRVIGGT